MEEHREQQLGLVRAGGAATESGRIGGAALGKKMKTESLKGSLLWLYLGWEVRGELLGKLSPFWIHPVTSAWRAEGSRAEGGSLASGRQH